MIIAFANVPIHFQSAIGTINYSNAPLLTQQQIMLQKSITFINQVSIMTWIMFVYICMRSIREGIYTGSLWDLSDIKDKEAVKEAMSYGINVYMQKYFMRKRNEYLLSMEDKGVIASTN